MKSAMDRCADRMMRVCLNNKSSCSAPPTPSSLLFFGLQIDPATLPPVLWPAVALAVVTGLTKVLTGCWAVRRAGGDTAGGLRAGVSWWPEANSPS
jgi:hypothetical protein